MGARLEFNPIPSPEIRPCAASEARAWDAFATLATATIAPAFAQPVQKPNILVIMGDDIGYWNISAYNRGMMGYRTPNIDRIANEGAIFTDYYGQQSCTAGRAAFITGQSPLRTGLLKVGLPAAKEGLSEKDPTIADLLKPQGYATGQFGKNHLGDRNEFLPTVHGFDEFFGNLYHLNAEDEPEHPDYPKDPAFKAQFGPRGVMKCVATATVTPGDDPRFGPWGKQKCEDTGPLTKKRMETVDEEFLAASLDFIDRANRDRKPFFVWFNPSRMHIWTRLKPESEGKTGLGIYPDGMVEHDGHVGRLLQKLDDLGIANNTIVIYTTDNGAETFSWPDGGTTPFRGEKNTNWEGGYRVPAMVRWPGLVPPRTEINDVFSAEDWATTLVAAAGEPDVKNKLLQGYDAAGKNFKVHLDGYDQRDLLSRKGPNKRREFFYWTDDGNLAGLRYEQLEGGVHGAEGARIRCLGATHDSAAAAVAVQSAHGPVRAGPARGRRVCPVVRRARLRAGPGAGDRGPAPDELPAVPAAPEAGLVRGRTGDGETAKSALQQLITDGRRIRSAAPVLPTHSGTWTMNKSWSLRAILLASLGSVLLAPAASAQQQPNILFILADNVGYGDVGAYGGGELRGAPTPRIDRLAAESLRLTQFLVEPSCTPSRAALMTGRYSIRSGLSLVAVPGTAISLPAREITMAEMLRDAGYATAIFGKWHLGAQPYSQPQNKGFDEFYGIPPADTWDAFGIIRQGRQTKTLDLPLDKGPHIVTAKRGEPLRTVKPYTEEVRRNIDWELVDHGVDFMKRQKTASKPFFLYLPISRTHFPNLPSKRFEGASRIGQFGDSLMEGDAIVGTMLDSLNELGLGEKHHCGVRLRQRS